MHGSLHVVPRRHSAACWIFRKILFVQRRATCWRKSRTSLARRACPRWQFRLAVLLPSRVESDFCRCTLASCATYGSHTVRFFAASHGHPACRTSCLARRDAERFGIAHFGRDSIRHFQKKMQLTLDPRTVSFASKVMVPV